MVDKHDNQRPLAVIFGCAGLSLSEAERLFFAEADPLGFILFKRNCDNPDQVRALVRELRASVGRPDAPVLIDQEGGRVQRLGPPHWVQRPAQNVFARIAVDDRRKAIEAASINARLIGEELIGLGIDVDCLPLLDVPVPGSHDVIGDRAFGHDPEIVAELGQGVVSGLTAAGVTPVIKHIPGHGRATADSHMALPVVDTRAGRLRETDFHPFATLRDAPWAMTAHVVYEAFDPMRPATLSETVITEVIRGEIGFSGFLLSDDISMKALTGPMGETAAHVIEAGCDAVLHCNGDMDEMLTIAEHVPEMSTMAWERFESGLAVRPVPQPTDIPALEAYLADLIGNYLD